MIRLRFERKRMVSRERKHTRKKETLSLNTLSCTWLNKTQRSNIFWKRIHAQQMSPQPFWTHYSSQHPGAGLRRWPQALRALARCACDISVWWHADPWRLPGGSMVGLHDSLWCPCACMWACCTCSLQSTSSWRELNSWRSGVLIYTYTN